MPLLEETTVPQEHPLTLPVVIIGKLSGFLISPVTPFHLSNSLVHYVMFNSNKAGFVCRERTFRYLPLLPAQWIQTLLRHNDCPPKPNAIQKTAADQACPHNRAGKNLHMFSII